MIWIACAADTVFRHGVYNYSDPLGGSHALEAVFLFPVLKPIKYTLAARGAYDVAKAGGKHAGFLRNYAGRTPAEIQKAITSIEKRIADHRSWIANPQSKIPNFGSLDPRQQAALINSKWSGDIARQQEQLDILRGLLGDT